MHRLGISIYPSQASLEENINYIKLASKYGFERIFTCLISLENIEKDLDIFKKIISVANKEGMKVIADITPDVFEKLDLDYKSLKFFKDIGLEGIRLDLGFSGKEESYMSLNKHNLKIEINMSNGTKYLENILSYKPQVKNIYGCHNFYPHKYTGLSREHFLKTSKQFKSKGIKTAAFVSSQNADFGPWPVSEGLCTLESHRYLDIDTQAKDLFNTELIDDVIISNCFASEEELKTLSEVNPNILTLKVDLFENISDIEKEIVIDNDHFNRGDVSEYVIRSTQSRVKYKDQSFKPKNTCDIKKGDILIDNDLYNRYSGELQIALKDRKNDGKTNIIGKVIEQEKFLLDKIAPWQSFKFKLNSLKPFKRTKN